MSIAHVFPGQGSQFSGMGKSLFESDARAREMFEEANEILGFRITDVMFEGSDEDLRATEVTQPAVFLHSVILAKCKVPGKPDMVAGHSLGEFSALVAAGALSFEDALRLVSVRASEMQRCCEKVPGSMAAVIGLPEDTIAQVCMGCGGLVLPANFNCDGQVVISGETESVAEACRNLKDAGAKRALMLPVGGAFHSPLMEPARAALGKAIEKTAFMEPFCPVYQNATALPSKDPAVIKKNLLRQLTSPVRWTMTVKHMLSDGADSFLEIGPGNVLRGLVARLSAGLEVNISGISE